MVWFQTWPHWSMRFLLQTTLCPDMSILEYIAGKLSKFYFIFLSFRNFTMRLKKTIRKIHTVVVNRDWRTLWQISILIQCNSITTFLSQYRWDLKYLSSPESIWTAAWSAPCTTRHAFINVFLLSLQLLDLPSLSQLLLKHLICQQNICVCSEAAARPPFPSSWCTTIS